MLKDGDEQRRREATAWLRAYPGEFWREHTPEQWRQLPPSVRCQPAPDLWDQKFDLTFRDTPNGRQCSLSAAAVELLVRKWAQRLARSIGHHHHLLVAHTIALTDGEGRPHVHGVLSLPPPVSLDSGEMRRMWRALGGGPHSTVERYDRERGAIRYALDHGGTMLPNVACPRDARCRRGRCLGARYPWRPADAEMNEGRAAERRRRRDA